MRSTRSKAFAPVQIIVIEKILTGEHGDTYYSARSAADSKARIFMRSGRGDLLAKGSRVLARIRRAEDESKGDFEADIIRVIGSRAKSGTKEILAVYTGGMLEPISRRDSQACLPEKIGKLEEGDLVRAEIAISPRTRKRGKVVAIVERKVLQLGRLGLIAVHAHELRHEFPLAVKKEAARAAPVLMTGREDLRSLPLLTIDPEDAEDHDDAIYARADAGNTGGHSLIIAIADVAHYVAADSALDQEARERGNSVYLPDMVLPMLPEKLSGDLCSLKAGVDRPVLAAEITIDAHGRKRSHRFFRAMIRVARNYTYDEALAESERDKNLLPLMAAHKAMEYERVQRAPLAIEQTERGILFHSGGFSMTARIMHRLHRLVENCMILANIAAAETLSRGGQAFIRRYHQEPDDAKLAGLQTVLDTLAIKLPHRLRRARDFNRLLAALEKKIGKEAAEQLIMRAQSRALYHAGASGHFGLNLPYYTHFTSPIRRYADLLVHRALLHSLSAAGGRIHPPDDLARLADAVSQAERRAALAEWNTLDRYQVAEFAAGYEQEFSGRIFGLNPRGFFVRFEESGAQGFLPARSLPRASKAKFGDTLSFRVKEISIPRGEIVLAPAGGGRKKSTKRRKKR